MPLHFAIHYFMVPLSSLTCCLIGVSICKSSSAGKGCCLAFHDFGGITLNIAMPGFFLKISCTYSQKGRLKSSLLGLYVGQKQFLSVCMVDS